MPEATLPDNGSPPAWFRGMISHNALVAWPTQRHFNSFFIAYTKAFNKAYGRTGSLFEKPFKRKPVDNKRYFTALVTSIHRNPQTHGIVDAFQDRPWSSYGAMLTDRPTKLPGNEVLAQFGGQDAFVDTHLEEVDERRIRPLIVDEFV